MSLKPDKFKDDFGTLYEEDELFALNKSLQWLAEVFPNAPPNVLREMLIRYNGESAVNLIANQLLSAPENWIRECNDKAKTTDLDHRSTTKSRLTIADHFRSAKYKVAVFVELRQEFAALRDSTIKTVLAEENYDYKCSRESLQTIAGRQPLIKLERFLWRTKKAPRSPYEKHPNLRWILSADGTVTLPIIRKTASAELDQEIDITVVEPLRTRLQQKQIQRDHDLGIAISKDEAMATRSSVECQCCFNELCFEQVTFCNEAAHAFCFSCLLKSLAEATYGQGWRSLVDNEKGLLMCCALQSTTSCKGSIDRRSLQLALQQMNESDQLLEQFELRSFKESIRQSGMDLVQCPFCPYAESSDVYHPRPHVYDRLRPPAIRQLFLSLINILVALVLYLPCWLPNQCFLYEGTKARSTTGQSPSPTIASGIGYSPTQFRCRSVKCQLRSCMDCRKFWRDPHVCDESMKQSRRRAIENARTNVIKRTCPRCGLGFIKDSGCNKIVCHCGNMICHACRANLSAKSKEEAYGHFCQHFRPSGGPCTVCNRCDLYQDLDGEEAIRLAGVEAAKAWSHEHEGKASDKAAPLVNRGRAKSNTDPQRPLHRRIDWSIR